MLRRLDGLLRLILDPEDLFAHQPFRDVHHDLFHGGIRHALHHPLRQLLDDVVTQGLLVERRGRRDLPLLGCEQCGERVGQRRN